MKKLYTYTFHLPNGTHVSTAPYCDLIQLRKAAMCLLTSLDLDPNIREILKCKASNDIAELKLSIKEFTKQTKIAGKEKAKAEKPTKTGALKEPGKKLGSSYAYQKQWRLANPEKYAAAKEKEKLRKAGKLMPKATK